MEYTLDISNGEWDETLDYQPVLATIDNPDPHGVFTTARAFHQEVNMPFYDNKPRDEPEPPSRDTSDPPTLQSICSSAIIHDFSFKPTSGIFSLSLFYSYRDIDARYVEKLPRIAFYKIKLDQTMFAIQRCLSSVILSAQRLFWALETRERYNERAKRFKGFCAKCTEMLKLIERLIGDHLYGISQDFDPEDVPVRMIIKNLAFFPSAKTNELDFNQFLVAPQGSYVYLTVLLDHLLLINDFEGYIADHPADNDFDFYSSNDLDMEYQRHCRRVRDLLSFF